MHISPGHLFVCLLLFIHVLSGPDICHSIQGEDSLRTFSCLFCKRALGMSAPTKGPSRPPWVCFASIRGKHWSLGAWMLQCDDHLATTMSFVCYVPSPRGRASCLFLCVSRLDSSCEHVPGRRPTGDGSAGSGPFPSCGLWAGEA